jgi:hypothetical protein
MVSALDDRTLLPRKNLSVYLVGAPVNTSKAELKYYNPSTKTWDRIPQDDPHRGWSIDAFPIIPDMPTLGYSIQARFKKRQASVQGIWLLSHYVTGETCPKCNSSNTVSDVTLVNDPDKVLLVQFEAKLAQDFLKMLLTPAGSDPYYPWIGTALADLPGTKFNQADTQALLSRQIASVGDSIKNLQSQQATIPAQQMDPREMLDSISLVEFSYPTSDSRIVVINIELYTMARTKTTIQFPFST